MGNIMIKRPLFIFSVLCIALMTSPLSHAGKFYKWVDGAGVTHYGENPPDTETAIVINVKAGASSDQAKELDKLDAQRKAAQQDSTPKEDANAEVERRNKEIMANNCKIQRQNLSQLQANSRVKQTDENGTIRYLSAEEISARTKEIQKYIDDNCKDL